MTTKVFAQCVGSPFAFLRLILIGLCCSLPLAGQNNSPGVIARISVAADGSQSIGTADSALEQCCESVSRNGRFVAFLSNASNFGLGGTPSFMNAYVRDTCLGAMSSCTPTTSLLVPFVPSSGSYSIKISADGRYASFQTGGTGSPPHTNVFLRDTCFGAAAGASDPQFLYRKLRTETAGMGTAMNTRSA